MADQTSGTFAGAAEQHDAGTRRAGLLAPLRWLGRKLSGLLRWAAKRLAAPLRRLMPRWVPKHVPAPLRWLGRLLAPGRERGFGFWWLVATLVIAVALGMVVALLLTPVAGLIALLVVAIWALVRRRRSKRERRSSSSSQGRPPPVPGVHPETAEGSHPRARDADDHRRDCGRGGPGDRRCVRRGRQRPVPPG